MPPCPADLAEKRAFLSQFLQEHAVQLQGIIRSYVVRGGLAQGGAALSVARDVFQDMALEALAHANRIDPTTLPWAWLLSIALNIIKRKKSSEARRNQREVTLSHMAPAGEPINEQDLFEQIVRSSSPGPEQITVTHEQVQEILALVSASDAQVLRLAIIDGLNTEYLARALGIRQVAARVRLHRALKRLRAAWKRHEASRKRGEDYA